VGGLSTRLPPRLVSELFRRSGAARWDLPELAFVEALDASLARAAAGQTWSEDEARRYAETLHLEDLALARACILGHDAAWEHFMLQHRPALYRAADALDPSGGAREIADALYAELYGVRKSDGGASLFTYFHGRSSLGTWLRAVLSQRYVDRVRIRKREAPLPDDERGGPAVPSPPADPDRAKLVPLVWRALAAAIAALAAKDRLRLRSYHVAGLTLAQIGRITAEHEATVSRQLARVRKEVRAAAESWLRKDARLDEAQVARAFELALEDSGGLDLERVFVRKEVE
jgi:RNA polymerase sigma-70 factor (ECF subfamily)